MLNHVYMLDAAPAATGTPTGMEAWSMPIMLVVFIAAMYFFMIRPQKKQEKQIAEMREMIAQFSDSRNEVFAEAGGKLFEVFESLVRGFSEPVDKGRTQAEKGNGTADDSGNAG